MKLQDRVNREEGPWSKKRIRRVLRECVVAEVDLTDIEAATEVDPTWFSDINVPFAASCEMKLFLLYFRHAAYPVKGIIQLIQLPSLHSALADPLVSISP